MRAFVGGLLTETNTFAPIPTGLGAFLEHDIHRRDHAPVNGYSPMLDRLRALARRDGIELHVGFAAGAMPGGTVPREVYERLRDELLAALEATLPVDLVVLPLHGAMVADGYPDCEGDLLERIRSIVGERVAIGVEVDPHCHYTRRMHANADVIVAYKEYPHTDVLERLDEVWAITLATARGTVRPVTAVHDCRMVGFWYTTSPGMRRFVDRMHALEREPGVLSVNFGHGFQYADVPEAGAKVWVTTDAAVDAGGRRAAAIAARLGQEIWGLRESAGPRYVSIEEALDRVAGHRGGAPLVLADVADNPGGGAAGDATFLLRRVVERGLTEVALGAFWDPGAVAICREAGVGAELPLRVGGKVSPASGAPVDLRVRIRAISEGHSQADFDTREACGTGVWVTASGDVDLVLITARRQVLGTDLFTGLGVDLPSRRAIIVKSAQHFHASFAPLAADVLYVDSPALLVTDFASIPYRVRDLNFWPRVADPWAEPGQCGRQCET